MTSTRKAKNLTNYYRMVFDFNRNMLPDWGLGVTMGIPIKVDPPNDVWHYLGIVLAEVDGHWSKVEQTVKAMPFAFTDGKWIRIPCESGSNILYRGLLVPVDTTDCALMLPLSMFNGGATWKIYVGAGYRRHNHLPTVREAAYMFDSLGLGDNEVEWADKEEVEMFRNYEGWDLAGLFAPLYGDFQE